MEAGYRYNVFKDHIQLQDYEIHDGMVSRHGCTTK
jgi:phenolic acid decarboxylase